MTPRTIVVVGMPGAGKTFVCRHLAALGIAHRTGDPIGRTYRLMKRFGADGRLPIHRSAYRRLLLQRDMWRWTASKPTLLETDWWHILRHEQWIRSRWPAVDREADAARAAAFAAALPRHMADLVLYVRPATALAYRRYVQSRAAPSVTFEEYGAIQVEMDRQYGAIASGIAADTDELIAYARRYDRNSLV